MSEMLATSLLLLQTPWPPSGTTSGGTVETPDKPTYKTTIQAIQVQEGATFYAIMDVV